MGAQASSPLAAAASTAGTNDIAKCSLCTQYHTDPVLLPCFHTFCRQCLHKRTTGSPPHPGAKRTSLPPPASCPTCGKAYVESELQSNAFVERISALRKSHGDDLAGNNSNRCDICRTKSAKPASSVVMATKHCPECEQIYCDSCSDHHAKVSATESHRLVDLASMGELRFRASGRCSKHGAEKLKLYCVQCSAEICVLCFAESHKAHDCCDVEKLTDDYRHMIGKVVSEVEIEAEKWRRATRRLAEEVENFKSEIGATELELNKSVECLKRKIDAYKDKLVEELWAVEKTRTASVEKVRMEMERHVTQLESFVMYSDAVKQIGTLGDLKQASSSLSQRVSGLLESDVSAAMKSVPALKGCVTFEPSDVLNRSTGNVVGRILIKEKECEILTDVAVNTSIPGGNTVKGITSLDDNVFIIRQGSKQVEVYDVDKLTLRCQLTVPNLGVLPSSVSVCAHHRCLYVSDWFNNCVHRVQPETISHPNKSGARVTKWLTSRHPVWISIASSAIHGVLVLSRGCGLIEEYSTSGLLVRSVTLQTSLREPRQAIQLSDGTFLVSHAADYGNSCGISIVGASGNVLKSYKGPASILESPGGMVVDRRHGSRILIADRDTDRILVVESTLSGCVLELEVSCGDQEGLKSPDVLWLDETRDRLYVSLKTDGSVLVIRRESRDTKSCK